MFWSNNFQTNDTKIKLNTCFLFWLVQNFEFIYISLSNWWSKLKDPIMHTQSELFDGCGTHAYMFASYPCQELFLDELFPTVVLLLWLLLLKSEL